MAADSAIEWTESTWNPLTGCTKISPGCKHCYAERMALRLQAMGQPNYAKGFKLALHENALELPLKWKKPQTIFVNSMSDLFHQDVPVDFILKTFDVMRRADWHNFQVLTKRSERLLEISPILPWRPHIWMGVSVETLRYTPRIDDLRQTGAMVKFLSLEPLLGPLPWPESEGHRLGDRGRRIRPRRPPHGPGLGLGHSRPVPRRARSVFLQAVGRDEKEKSRTRTPRPNVG